MPSDTGRESRIPAAPSPVKHGPRPRASARVSQCESAYAFRISVAGSGGRSSPADRVSREPPGGMPAWDAIVIGSGFGGAMAAHALVTAGHRVLMLERGGWVARGPQNWTANGVGLTTPHYTTESPYEVMSEADATAPVRGSASVVSPSSTDARRSASASGTSKQAAEIVADSGAAWPFGYDVIEPFYARAEQFLGVAGEAGADPTEPPRSTPYPQRPAPLRVPRRSSPRGNTSRTEPVSHSPGDLVQGGREPARLHALWHVRRLRVRRRSEERRRDRDHPDADRERDDAAAEYGMCALGARRFARGSGGVRGQDHRRAVPTDRPGLRARRGCARDAHPLLASELAERNRAGHCVGRYFMRHRNAVFGVYARQPNPQGTFDKQIAIHDFYFGAPEWDPRHGPLGGIQQLDAARRPRPRIHAIDHARSGGDARVARDGVARHRRGPATAGEPRHDRLDGARPVRTAAAASAPRPHGAR